MKNVTSPAVQVHKQRPDATYSPSGLTYTHTLTVQLIPLQMDHRTMYKTELYTHRRAAATFNVQCPLDFQFMTVVSMHRHASCLIRTAHIMRGLCLSNCHWKTGQVINHDLHHCLLLCTCQFLVEQIVSDIKSYTVTIIYVCLRSYFAVLLTQCVLDS